MVLQKEYVLLLDGAYEDICIVLSSYHGNIADPGFYKWNVAKKQHHRHMGISSYHGNVVDQGFYKR